MAETFDLEMPDGTVIKDIPEGTTKAQIAAKLGKSAPNPLFEALREAGRVADQTVRGGALALPGIAGDLLYHAGNFLEKKFPITPESMKAPVMPPSEALATLTGGPINKPQTTPGKFAGSVGEGVVSALTGPGGLVRPGLNAAIGGAAGAGSEVGALVYDSPVARLVGALVGGGATAIGGSHIPNATKLLKQQLEFVTPADAKNAVELQATFKEHGIDNLASSLYGPSSTLNNLVTVMSTHPSTRGRLVNAVRNIPEQTHSALLNWSEKNLPQPYAVQKGILPTQFKERRDILDDAQGIGKAVIDSLSKKATAAYLENLPPDYQKVRYTIDQVKQLYDDLRTLANSTDHGPTSGGGELLNTFAEKLKNPATGDFITNAAQLDNLSKETFPQLAKAVGYKGLAVKQASGMLRDFTKDVFGPARDAMSNTFDTLVNPAKKSLVGDLSRMGGGNRPDKSTASETALNWFFPKASAQPEAIKYAGELMGGDQVGRLLRENFARNIETAVKSTPHAVNPQVGYKFYETVAGTPAQRTNLQAAFDVIAPASGADPKAVSNGFFKFLRALESTKYTDIAPTLDKAAIQQAAGLSVPGLVAAPHTRGSRWLWERATAKTFNDIADILLSPDVIPKLEAIAKAPTGEPTKALTSSILSTVFAQPDQNLPMEP